MKETQDNSIKPFEKNLTIQGRQARYYDFSELLSDQAEANLKPTAHFYGGNGFPVGVYEPLLTTLNEHFHVISLAMQGYWHDLPTDKVLTREQDADNLIEFLDNTQVKPVIGIGHSQGATATAMAAAKRPDLFAALYLIDPVTFTKAQKILYDFIPRRILMTQEPFKSTLVKQLDWDSIDDYYQHLRQHRAFKRISDAHLLIFAQNSLVKQDNGKWTLLFKPEQELASYFGTPYITDALKQLNQNKTPYHILLAKLSVFNSDKVRQSWQGIVSSEKMTTFFEYGHLLPMEAPNQCAKLIIESIDKKHPITQSIYIPATEPSVQPVDNYTLSIKKSLNAMKSRDGYQRQRALENVITLLSKDVTSSSATGSLVTNTLPIDALLDALIERQNDYVTPVRELAAQALLNLISRCDFETLVSKTHEFLTLRNQSRAEPKPILDKLLSLYLQPNHQRRLYSIFDNTQDKRKAIRAVAQLLAESGQIDDNKFVPLVLSSSDLFVNMQAWDIVTTLPIKEQRTLLLNSDKANPLYIQNKQFYFKLLMNLIYHNPYEVWQDIVITYLPKASSSQLATLWFYLNKHGIDFQTLTTQLIKRYDEVRASRILIMLAQHLDADILQAIVECYPHWQNWHANKLIESVLLKMPEHDITQNLLTTHPNYQLSTKLKIRLLAQYRMVNEDHYLQTAQLLKLSDRQYLKYSRYLSVWPQFIFLIHYAEQHHNRFDDYIIDNVPKQQDPQKVKDVYNEVCDTLLNKMRQTAHYSQSLTVIQIQQIRAGLKNPQIRQYFAPILPELRLMKLVDND